MTKEYLFLTDHYAEGHHAAFVKLFTKYLVTCGYHVVVSFPEEKKEWITLHLINDGVSQKDFTIVENNLARTKVTGWGLMSDAISAFLLWKNTYKQIRRVEKIFNIRITKVFFAWLDDYLANYLPYSFIDIFFRYSWSGLFFHPWYLYSENLKSKASITSIDALLRSRYCHSVAIHDEFIKDRLTNRVNKPVIVFPEIADSTVPADKFWLVDEIKRRAANRTIIGLIGLSRRKGVRLLVQMALQADPSKYFFFFAGPITWEEYAEEEKNMLIDFFHTQRPNVFYHAGYLTEGGEINAVIQEIDVLYLVYENFRSSSNFSTKAALFRKPVLGTKNYWIGNVTRKYRMGEVVDENDTSQALSALDRLNSQLISNTFDFSGYEAYLENHREQNLEIVFKKCFR